MIERYCRNVSNKLKVSLNVRDAIGSAAHFLECAGPCFVSVPRALATGSCESEAGQLIRSLPLAVLTRSKSGVKPPHSKICATICRLRTQPANSPDVSPHRWRTLVLLAIAELLGMSLWFSGSAVVPALT